MAEDLVQNLQRSLVDSKSKEIFSWNLFGIIVGMHILALGGLTTYSSINVAAWALAHFYFVTVGASLGYHRLFSHRSFTPVPWLGKVIAVTATLCFQGSPTFWAAGHRVHHVLTESYGDPYSAKRGFWWSHLLWLFHLNPNGFSYLRARRLVSDLKRDRLLVWLETNATALNFVSMAVLFVICWSTNNLGLFFWIGPIRIVTVWHSVWLTNSYSHYAPFTGRKVGDAIRNSLVMSILTGGDGDHEFHHKNPNSVRHSGRALNLDHSYWLLKSLKALGLVKFRPPIDS